VGFFAQAPTLPPPGVAILGAIVGATAAIVAALITSWRLLKVERVRSEEARDLERIRSEEARDLERIRSEEARDFERIRSEEARAQRVAEELSAAAQQLTIKMSAALHSMCWITWLARARSDRITQDRLDVYDSELHELIPEILGYLSTVAALDMPLYRRLQPLAYNIFTLDAYIGFHGLALDENPDTTIRALDAAYEGMAELELQLPNIVGDVVSGRVENPVLPLAVRNIVHPAEFWGSEGTR
jgi:hypothetical protein